MWEINIYHLDKMSETSENNVLVSRKHFSRKEQVEKQQTDVLLKSISTAGPIAGIMIRLFDGVIEFFGRLFVDLLKISEFSFNYFTSWAFGNYSGIFPNAEKYGTAFTYKFFRYCANVLVPPFGVYLSKGFFGWFNVAICFVLTYVHYALGIIYAFIVTHKNKYADLYERVEWEYIKGVNVNLQTSENEKRKGDIYAFMAIIATFATIIGIIVICIRFM